MRVIPHHELSRRRPVWEAMSAFFLDTELDDAQLREIAGMLGVSGYTESELDDILKTELAPLLYTNALDMVGVWDGFDLDWIERELLAGKHRTIQKWYNLNRFLCNWVIRGVINQYWSRVLIYFRDGQSQVAS